MTKIMIPESTYSPTAYRVKISRRAIVAMPTRAPTSMLPVNASVTAPVIAAMTTMLRRILSLYFVMIFSPS